MYSVKFIQSIKGTAHRMEKKKKKIQTETRFCLLLCQLFDVLFHKIAINVM